MLTGHKFREVTESLSEDHVPMLRNTLLELLLEVPAPMLVFAQRRNLALEILEPHTREAVNWRRTDQRRNRKRTRTLKTDTHIPGPRRRACAWDHGGRSSCHHRSACH